MLVTGKVQTVARFVQPKLSGRCSCHCPSSIKQATCNADKDKCKPEDGLCVEKSWPNHSKGTKNSCFRLFQNEGLVCCSIVGEDDGEYPVSVVKHQIVEFVEFYCD